MKKNIIIAFLTVLSIVEFISIRQMSANASYWLNRVEAAENYIEALETDFPDYIDTTSGCGAYSEWYQ